MESHKIFQKFDLYAEVVQQNYMCHKEIIEVARALLSLEKLDARFTHIDLGCGNGRIIIDFKDKLNKPFLYIGIDCCKELIEIAKKNNEEENVYFINMDIDKIDEYFLNKYKNYIFLFESSLCMVKYPSRILKLISQISNNILLSRIMANF